jgi:hypothetical protein
MVALVLVVAGSAWATPQTEARSATEARSFFMTGFLSRGS